MLNYDFLGDVQRYVLATPLYKINADNYRIVNELENSTTRMSEYPLDSYYEDYRIDFDRCYETKRLCDAIDDIIYNRFSEPNNVITPDNKWAHIHKPLESGNSHTHKPAHISFVYYVKVPEGAGQFVFLMDSANDDVFVPITPVEGTLMIFPSWVKHKISKNLSNDLRISISGNYFMESK